MKSFPVSFTPNPAVTDPADIVAKFKFSATVDGKEVLPMTEYGPGDVATVTVDPGAAGVDVVIDYSFADAAGNYQPLRQKTQRVEPDKVPDTTPPPEAAGDLNIGEVVSVEATPEPAKEVAAEAAPAAEAPVADVAPVVETAPASDAAAETK